MNPLNTNGHMEAENHVPGLAERLKAEVDRAWKVKKGALQPEKPKDVQPATNEEYLAMFNVLTTDEIRHVLNTAERAAERALDDPPQMIEYRYSPGSLFCLAFLAITESGLTLEREGEPNVKDWVERGALLRGLHVNSDTHSTHGFGGADGYYFDYLPECLTRDVEEGGCTFKLEYPEGMIGHPSNGEWFAEKYAKAVENLQKIFAGRFMN